MNQPFPDGDSLNDGNVGVDHSAILHLITDRGGIPIAKRNLALVRQPPSDRRRLVGETP
jgi:hypothetical protein